MFAIVKFYSLSCIYFLNRGVLPAFYAFILKENDA